ncbi:MAG: Glycine cleavage system H protein [Hyphomicrobiaceae bacterium hypho_1]
MAQDYFSKDHEYARVDGGIATIGITMYAQRQLGDVVYVEVPELGRKVSAGEVIAVVESVKTASEIYAPIAGEVLEVNSDLEDNPALVNDDAEGSAWFFKLKIADPDQLSLLMSRTDYDKLTLENS